MDSGAGAGVDGEIAKGGTTKDTKVHEGEAGGSQAFTDRNLDPSTALPFASFAATSLRMTTGPRPH